MRGQRSQFGEAEVAGIGGEEDQRGGSYTKTKFHEPNGVSLKLILSSAFLGLKYRIWGKEQLQKSYRPNNFWNSQARYVQAVINH